LLFVHGVSFVVTLARAVEKRNRATLWRVPGGIAQPRVGTGRGAGSERLLLRPWEASGRRVSII
jgi:hypothetical protein